MATSTDSRQDDDAEDFQAIASRVRRSRAATGPYKQQQEDQQHLKSSSSLCAPADIACHDQQVHLTQEAEADAAATAAGAEPIAAGAGAGASSVLASDAANLERTAATTTAIAVAAAASTDRASEASEGDSDADWDSDWSDEEEPLPPAAEAMLQGMSGFADSSCRTGLATGFPFKVSQWVEEAMMGLPSDIDDGKFHFASLVGPHKHSITI